MSEFEGYAPNIWAALIIAVPAMFSPIIMALVTFHIQRRSKIEDYERQDEVARKADVAAAKVAETAKLLLASNAAVAETAKLANGKLDQIHILVNSTLTASKLAEFNALVALLALMQNPVAVDAGEIEITQKKIEELRTVIAERAKQTELADSHLQHTT